MKWLLTFLAGILLGAGALFVYLRQIPQDPPAAVAVVAAPAAAVAPVPPPAAAAPDPMADLPKAPVVIPDLTEADLPLRPSETEFPVVPLAADGPKPAEKLLVPVDGIKLAQLSDTFNEARGKERQHEALDIMAPKGSKVRAAADGKVVKLFNSKPGGLTVYQFDTTEKFVYYYAHLDRYADGITENTVLKRGDLVGYVGSTGNADPKAPHLHFAVVVLTPEKQWWKGGSINPYPLMAD